MSHECVTYITVTYKIMFCLLCLCPNKKKETKNKIKRNERKGK